MPCPWTDDWPGKCKFAISKTELLGHHLSSSGLRPHLKHTSAIREFPPSSDKPGLQCFLGMINFYQRFLRNTAQVLAPLTNALKGSGKSLFWSPMLDSAFFLAKQLLSSVPVLSHPETGAPVSLAVEASESKDSAFDRELLAAYSAVCHFCFLLEGREFTLFTDHKPLTHALFHSSPPWSAQQQHHLAYISEFTSDILHVPGAENAVADALSRPYRLTLPPSQFLCRSPASLPLTLTSPLQASMSPPCLPSSPHVPPFSL